MIAVIVSPVIRPIDQIPFLGYSIRTTRYFDRVQQVTIVIDKAKNGYTVEILTDVERHDAFISTSTHEDLYACIDLSIDRSIRQLKDHKSKLRDNKHHTPIGGNEA